MRFRGGSVIATLVLAGVSHVAFAQEQMPTAPGPAPGGPGAIVAPEATVPERQSVLQRPRPDYDPLGIRAGSFLIYPYANLAEAYDSNVYAIPSPAVKGDFYTDLAPGAAVRSDWNNHALNFDASGDIKRYASLVSENVSNGAVSTSGRLDILRDIYAAGGLGYQLAHEDRSSPNSAINAKNPIEYQVVNGNVAYVHEPGRLSLRVDASASDYNYNNAETATGATIVETDRNRIEYMVKPRVSYEIVPGYHAFVQASGNERDYQAQFDQFGYNKSSKGYETDAGTAIDLGRLITGEVFAGYLSQSYDDPRLKTVSGVAFGGNLLWNVTELTSVRFTLTRAVQETVVTAGGGATIVDAAADLQTSASVSVEHELLRNVLLSAGAIFIQDDFQGIIRTDDNYEGDAGARYLINRNLSAGLDFSYRKRTSNVPGNDYEREIVTARLRTQF